jgi:hypothetical protein
VPVGLVLTVVLPGLLASPGGFVFALGEALAFTFLAYLTMAVQATLHVAFGQSGAD